MKTEISSLCLGIWLIVPGIFLVCATTALAAEFEHEFVGVKKCLICHKKPRQGEQYPIWKKSKHAHAYEVLGTPKAKEVAAKLEIEDPQKSGYCLKCHSTAYGFSEEKVTDVVPVEEGISCETCHGPGNDYRKMKTMKDHEAALAAGLIIPDESVCRKCHDAGGPNPQPFDFEKEWEKIKHPIPEKD